MFRNREDAPANLSARRMDVRDAPSSGASSTRSGECSLPKAMVACASSRDLGVARGGGDDRARSGPVIEIKNDLGKAIQTNHAKPTSFLHDRPRHAALGRVVDMTRVDPSVVRRRCAVLSANHTSSGPRVVDPRVRRRRVSTRTVSFVTSCGSPRRPYFGTASSFRPDLPISHPPNTGSSSACNPATWR